MRTARTKAVVTVYSRPGCHLCEEAKAEIESASCDGEFTLEEVNIDDDPVLLERYQYDIPVVLINGVKVFKHRVDPRDFKRKLHRLSKIDESAS
jgi:glutaredoxin